VNEKRKQSLYFPEDVLQEIQAADPELQVPLRRAVSSGERPARPGLATA
jgi:uncharacterized small protein (TIGR04563 family)